MIGPEAYHLAQVLRVRPGMSVKAFVRPSFLVPLVSLFFVCSACTFSYIPPIPESHIPPPRLELHAPEGLVYERETLRLSLALRHLLEPGWLAVQWFAPTGREAASDSLWVEPDEGLTHHLYLPGDVTLTPGRWRAVVSFGGEVLRQFAAEVP